MTTVDPPAAEARMASRYSPVAALAGALLVISALIKLGGVHTSINESTIGLITESKRGQTDVIGAIINALALLCMGGTLNFLFLAVRRRQPSIGSYIRGLALAGASVAGILGVVYWIIVRQKAHEFVAHGSQTWLEAKHLTGSAIFTVIPTAELAAALALAIAVVLVSLGAMRVGLLTRFMGWLGIIVGVLVLFPIGSPLPVVEAFWLIAVAVLLAGRWPNGMPPAWAAGEARPWPSSQQVREQRVRAAAERGRGGVGARRVGGVGAAGPDGGAARPAGLAGWLSRGARPAAPSEPAPPAAPAPRQPPRTSQKRKRKRRK